MIQVHKQRSFLDKMFGRNKLQVDDPVVRKIVAAVRAEPAFSDITEEPDR